MLYDRYEPAAQSVLDGVNSLFVVANAYQGASTFYMDPRLSFVGAYCLDTPQYGMATKDGTLPQGEVTIASHSAPIPLIDQLLTDIRTTAGEIIRYNSTSAAAAAAARGSVDIALTTASAASAHRLSFATRTRNIRMLWSVFGRSPGHRDARGEVVADA